MGRVFFAGGKVGMKVPMPLPSGYTQLAYIQSSGTQYIDTGVCPNQDTRIAMSGVFLAQSANASIFGARESSSKNMCTMTWVNSASYFLTNYGTGGLQIAFAAGSAFELDKNKNVTTLNGATVTADEATFSCPVSLFLFATNGNGSVMHYGKVRLEMCRIYDGDQLIRDFLPCVDPDGNIGLYDLVGKQFYGNAGSGVFTGRLTEDTLPAGYSELAYIQSSGTQFINTAHVVASENLRIVMKFRYAAAHSDSTLFGSETSGITGSGEYSICPWGPTPEFYVGGSKGLSAGPTTSLNTDYVLDVTAKNGTLTAIWNGTVYTAAYTEGLNHTYPVAIFGNNISGAVSQLCPMDLEYFQMYDDDELVRDLVPCIDANGNIGLFDKANCTFYGNAGSGSFVGSEVA